MIAGIGVDVVDLDRFSRAIARTPRLLHRLFAESEQELLPHSLAARFAAKEALIKALGGSALMRWTDMEVVTDPDGNPEFRLHGKATELIESRGIARIHLSITHDAGVACAFVIIEKAEK